MRLLSIILAILVMFLTVQPVCGTPALQQSAAPCCSAGCADEQEEKEEPQAPEKKECGVCNPFQSCSCCSGYYSFTQSGSPSRLAEIPYSAKKWQRLNCRLSEAPLDGFWQPPRA